MPLKARKPEKVEPSKPKFLISGESGVGKTFFALDFPRPYLIDTEIGATRPQYQEKLKKVGGAYFGKDEGSQDFGSVLDEVKALATEQHDFKTLIIDSFSYIYMLEAAIAEQQVGNDFGKDKKEAQKPTKQLVRWLDKLDMNVILIAHSKAKWARKGKEVYQDGTTFDGWAKMEYILDLWIEIPQGGKTFIVRKSRIDTLPQNDSFPLSYEHFADIYGSNIIESDSKPVDLATDEQISQVNELIDVLNVDQTQIDKWYRKVDVDDFSEMTKKQITGLIDMLKKKVEKVNK